MILLKSFIVVHEDSNIPSVPIVYGGVVNAFVSINEEDSGIQQAIKVWYNRMVVI